MPVPKNAIDINKPIELDNDAVIELEQKYNNETQKDEIKADSFSSTTDSLDQINDDIKNTQEDTTKTIDLNELEQEFTAASRNLVIPDYEDVDEYNIQPNPTYEAIEYCSNLLKEKFNSDYSWPFQFQLIYNGYQGEKTALAILRHESFIPRFNAKASLTNFSNILLDPDSDFLFNEAGYSHSKPNIFNIDSFGSDGNRNFVDIISTSTKENVAKNIEVKCTVAGRTPNNFHNADLIFVFELDTNILKIYYKTLKNLIARYTLSGPTVNIKNKCISAFLGDNGLVIKPFKSAAERRQQKEAIQ